MSNKFIVLECEMKILKISISDILYIKYEKELTTIILISGEKLCHKSLTELSKILPGTFIRINRNCIVNFHAIMEFNKKERLLILDNEDKLMVSHRNIKNITDAFRTLSVDA